MGLRDRRDRLTEAQKVFRKLWDLAGSFFWVARKIATYIYAQEDTGRDRTGSSDGKQAG